MSSGMLQLHLILLANLVLSRSLLHNARVRLCGRVVNFVAARGVSNMGSDRGEWVGGTLTMSMQR